MESIKKHRMIQKRAQNETVGFVIIILLVMIAGVIFLGISLRKRNSINAADAEIANFLIASSKYTTACAENYEYNYQELGDVATACYSQTNCFDGNNSCDILNDTYSKMLKGFRPAGKAITYYKLSFSYKQNLSSDSSDRGLKFGPEITWGNYSLCASRRAGRTYISAGEGSIIEQMDICSEN